jgi:hypothetical protein
MLIVCCVCVGDWSASARLTTYLPIHVFSASVGLMLTVLRICDDMSEDVGTTGDDGY